MNRPRFVEIFQYNAFTRRPFAGNPAGVVLDASRLDEERMQQIARQLNLAETAFLTEPSSRAADVRLRWFTPTQEVDLCGHATIAAFTAAAEHGVYPVDQDEERVLRVETLSGVLRIRILRPLNATQVAMQIPVPSFHPLKVERSEFAALWGATLESMAGEWLVHEGLNYWYLPVGDLEALRALTLDADRLARWDPTAAFAFHTPETVDPKSDWHLRFFAPFHGVPEDIVTGSAQGPMGVVHLRGTVGKPVNGWTELQGEQGDTLGRPGRVGVRVLQDAGEVRDLEIVGGAVSMLEGRIAI